MTRLERRVQQLNIKIMCRFHQSEACKPRSDAQWKHHRIAARLNRKRHAAIAKSRLRREGIFD